MIRYGLALLALAGFSGFLPAQTPLTRAEKTDYRETSHHADVLQFLDQVTAGQSDMELTVMGRTAEDRAIPLVIVAPPELRTPARAHASGRLVVYLQANIHAGEVEGKEASLMLLREFAAGKHAELRDQLVLLMAPIYNADGNERFSTLNRTNQIGPEGGVGQRPNAMNLDLNRDYMKNDAPETRAALALYAAWDPHLIVDMHTTNGCKHRYALTYASSSHPNADRTVQDFMDHVLLPEVRKALKPEYELFYYGGFLDRGDPTQGWGTFAWHGRYGTNYYGLRNRFSILSEAYAYVDFRTRVAVTRKFVLEVLRRAVAHRGEMLSLTAAADRGTAAGAFQSQALEAERKAWPGTHQVLGYEVTPESRKRYRPAPEDQPRDYDIPLFLAFEPSKRVAVPLGYLMPRGLAEQAEHLERHGIRVYRLRQGGDMAVEVCRMEKLERSEKPYQGRPLQHAEVSVTREERTFAPGDYWIPTRQPLGRLAAELLEPRGHDGLLAWGFLDAHLFPQWGRKKMVIPVFRVTDAMPWPVVRDSHVP